MEHDDSQLTPSNAAIPAFVPVPTRYRYDGWSPDAQLEFIEALAECVCVDDACRRVGKSTASAYKLRRRHDAVEFRAAWEAALDYGVDRLSDAAFFRARSGHPNPTHFTPGIFAKHYQLAENFASFLRNPCRIIRPVFAARRLPLHPAKPPCHSPTCSLKA